MSAQREEEDWDIFSQSKKNKKNKSKNETISVYEESTHEESTHIIEPVFRKVYLVLYCFACSRMIYIYMPKDICADFSLPRLGIDIAECMLAVTICRQCKEVKCLQAQERLEVEYNNLGISSKLMDRSEYRYIASVATGKPAQTLNKNDVILYLDIDKVRLSTDDTCEIYGINTHRVHPERRDQIISEFVPGGFI